MKRTNILVFGVAILLIAVAGCSKSDVSLATVRGRVTLDGQPLRRAAIVLAPVAGKGGPAYAVTNDDGQYEIAYTHNRKGAVIGECVVRIKTGFQSVEDEELKRARPERLPARYNKQTTLSVNVQPGGGPYDFDLKSK